MKIFASCATLIAALAFAAPANAAWTADVNGFSGSLVGDGDQDIVWIYTQGSLLRHNITGPGFSGPTDFNSAAGVTETIPNQATATLNIDAGGGIDIVSIGASDDPWTGLRPAFNVEGGGGSDVVSLVGPDATTPLSAQVTNVGVTAGVGNVSYAGTEGVIVELGGGPDTVNVQSTPVHSAVEIEGGAGADVATVNNPASIASPVRFDGDNGTDRLLYNDTASGANSYSIVGDSVTRNNGAPVTAHSTTEDWVVTTGAGADSIFKNGTKPVTINAGGGDDLITTRDSVSDSPNCGAGTDYVVTDALDTLLPECEGSDRPVAPMTGGGGGENNNGSGGSGGTGGDTGTPQQPQQPQVPPADKTAPTTTVAGLPKSVKLKALLKGVKPAIATDEAASVEVQLLGSTSTTKLSRAYNVTLAQGTLPLGTGARALKLKPSKKLLGKAKKFTVQVRVIATDAAGNRTTVVKTLRVKR